MITQSELLERLNKMQPHRKYSANDKGFGSLFADVFKDFTRFNVSAKEWYFFTGKIWSIDAGSMIVNQFAKKLVDALLIYCANIDNEVARKPFLDYVSKMGQFRYRQTIINDARDKYFIQESDLDCDVSLFNCQNGTYNLDTNEFKKHNPNDLLSKISNAIYDPIATAPTWTNFVEEIMQGDAEKITYLQKIFGYALTADTRLETCFIFYGASSRNGKSTLVETLLHLHGGTSGYAVSMKPETLAQKKNTDSRQASGDIARLKDCRFLNCSEIPKRMLLDISLLKTFLGRDSVTARHLHQREFEFYPHFKLFINTNYLPIVTDDTVFASGRVNIINFDRHFASHEQDKNLKCKLKKPSELSGIFNWCIDGLKLFMELGAEPPLSVFNATQAYRVNSDKVGIFFNECMEKSDKNSKAGSVYDKYKKWCDTNGFGTENKSNFFDELKLKNLYKDSGTVGGITCKRVVPGYEIVDDGLF